MNKLSFILLFTAGVLRSTAGTVQPVNDVLGDISFVSTFGSLPNESTNENLRITTHLKYVEKLLRNKNTLNLSEKLKQKREVLLDHLHTYLLAEAFPKNYDHCDRIPCFIDKDGNICAVGYLIEMSAGRAVAEKINSKHKYERIFEISDKAVDDWIANSGLTKEECAMIQPTYEGMKYQGCIQRGDMFFKEKNYKEAQMAYKEALAFKPGDALASMKIAEIDKILAELKKKQEMEAKDTLWNAGVIIKIPFVNKKGEKSANMFSLFFKTGRKEYFIKYCESQFNKAQLLPLIDKKIDVKVNFKMGLWDVCPGDPHQDVQSRGGDYVQLMSIKGDPCDSINLHAFVGKISQKEQDALGEQLKKDGASILFHEYASKTETPLISLVLPKILWIKLFQTTIEKKSTPANSSNKMLETWVLEKYVLPSKYKTKITKLEIPDPQQY